MVLNVSHIKIGDLVKTKWTSCTIIARVIHHPEDKGEKAIAYHYPHTTENNSYSIEFTLDKGISDIKFAQRVTKLG